MIKKQKNKLLTLLVASLIGSAAFGGALVDNVSVEAAETTYSVSTIFSTSSVTTSKTGDFKMEFSNGGKVTYTRDLALKWFEQGQSAVEAKYMNFRFKFEDTNFTTLTFTFETESHTATKDDKAINKIVFKTAKEGDNTTVSVSVNDSETKTSVDVTKELTVSLADVATEADQFDVMLKQGDAVATKVGTFENVGVNFAEYDTSKKMNSFVINAETATDAKTSVTLYELNGQSLELNADGKFTDDTAPVLVVNEEDIDGFVLGTAFSLNYEVIDVLDRTVDKSLTYYQYDPDDATKAKADYDASTDADKKIAEPTYNSLTTTTYFHETSYSYKDGETSKTTSVYTQTGGTEYVSIRFTLDDDGENEAKYYLGWYLADAKATIDTTIPGYQMVEGYTDIDYVKLYQNNEVGAYYTCIENVGTESNFVENTAYTAFVEELAELEKDLSAGDGSYLYLPSMKGLIGDNGGYSNLKFTISYKTTSNNSARTSSGLSASSLKLEVTDAEEYQFKIFAVDKAGNNMKYYLDGEEVEVTSSNVWDIDAIPSFSVMVKNNGLSVEEESSRKETEVLYGSYDLPDFDVIGPATVNEKYALFRLPDSFVSEVGATALTGITYEELKTAAESLKTAGSELSGLELYKLAYATVVSELHGVELTVDQVLAVLNDENNVIDEYNDRISEENHEDAWKDSDNAFAWKPSEKTFSPQEIGTYLVLAVFSDPDVPAYSAAAYMLVEVESEKDVIYGTTEWLKNNIASVILFGIAGLMLILIIILLVVKPSDETLEDIDEDKKKKAKKSEKKASEEKADSEE